MGLFSYYFQKNKKPWLLHGGLSHKEANNQEMNMKTSIDQIIV